MSIGGSTFLGVTSAVYSQAAGVATAFASAEILGAEVLPLATFYSEEVPENGGTFQNLLAGYRDTLKNRDSQGAKENQRNMAALLSQTSADAWQNIVGKLEAHPWATSGGLFATPTLEGVTFQIEDNFHERPYSRNIAIHPNQSGVILVNYPGLGGAIDGYNGKHRRLAEHIAQRGLAAVLRMDNPRAWEHGPLDDDEYKDFLIQGLRSVVRYAKAHANEICGREEYRLWLMGCSAGASAIAVLAQELGAEKILLMAPARTAGESAVLNGIENFLGDVAIVHGDNDSVVPVVFGERLFQMTTLARSRRFVVLPNCDHQFQGTVNGQIMSKAPFWAFGNDSSFPSPEGGLILY